jgi:hypothetical protein
MLNRAIVSPKEKGKQEIKGVGLYIYQYTRPEKDGENQQ